MNVATFITCSRIIAETKTLLFQTIPFLGLNARDDSLRRANADARA